jgi:hypothetical protein
VGDNPLQKQRHGGIEAQQHIASRSRPKTSQAGIPNKEVAEVLSHAREEGEVGERGRSRAMRGGSASWSDRGGGSRRRHAETQNSPNSGHFGAQRTSGGMQHAVYGPNTESYSFFLGIAKLSAI